MPAKIRNEELIIDVIGANNSPTSSGNRNRTTKKRGTSRRPGNGDQNLPPIEGEEDEDYDDCVTVDGV